MSAAWFSDSRPRDGRSLNTTSLGCPDRLAACQRVRSSLLGGLKQLLDAGIAGDRACKGCSFSEPRRLQETYPDGGNWDRNPKLGGPHHQPDACRPHAMAVVGKVVALYNLAPGPQP